MGDTVELPFWLVMLTGLLATISLIDRLLIPTVRWMLRRKVNDAIDELNQRLKLRIQPFKLTRRESLVDRMMLDHELVRAVETHSQATGEPRTVAMSRVQGYVREIVPSFNAYAYFKIGAAAARGLSTALYRVRLGYSHDEALRKIDPDSTVVFVINHRSNMDYVLVTYLASASSALSYAVGEWARVMLLQSLIRSMGAYFIRRESGDPLYRKVLARYVQIATAEGVTQAVFPEGGLTRDGALRPARLGLLSYIVGKFEPHHGTDVVFVPVGINYDRVLEDRNLTRAIAREAGTPIRRVGAGAVISYLARALKLRLTGKWYRFGYASVSFGEPLSLRDYMVQRSLDLQILGEEARFRQVDALAQTLMKRIGDVVPVLPVPLVAFVFLKAGGVELSIIELKARVMALVEDLETRGIRVHIPRSDLDYGVEAGLRVLTLRRLVTEDDGLYVAVHSEMVLITYYANSIAHHFPAA